MTGNASTRAVGTEAAGRSEPKSPTPMGGASVWSFDIENAPKGRMVEVSGAKGSVRRVHKPDLLIVAAPDGVTVTVSRWIPDESRWNMLGKNETPIAWMEWPTHPAARQASNPTAEGV